MTPKDLAARRDIAATLAREAAALAWRMRADGLGEASLKGAQDFLTEADGATEAFLRERLGQLFPGEMILGEEMGGAVAGDGPIWVLDPIDGTANFARGGDRWCVSVGMALERRAVLGAVARHTTAEIFKGARGCGATLNDQPIRAAGTTDIARATIELGWSSRIPQADWLTLAQKAMAAGAGIRRGGSGTLGLVESAAGRLDGYLEAHINSWDACAALAIARETGSWTSDFDSGDWLTEGNPVGIGAPALGAWLEGLLHG